MDPYDCPLMGFCWSFLPQPNVFDLRNARDKPWDLLARGILRMEDVPPDVVLTQAQDRQVTAHRTGNPHVDSTAIRQFFALFRSLLFRAMRNQFDSRGVSLNCAVLQEKVVAP